MNNLFRKSAIERISSPEQLDKLINITSTSSWMIFIALFLVCSSIIVWMFTGEFTETVEAKGVYIADQEKTEDDKGCIFMYVPLSKANLLSENMKVMIRPSFVSEETYGHMRGSVNSIDDFGITKKQLREELVDEQLIESVIQECGYEPIVKISLKIQEDDNSENGYKWSNPKGENLRFKKYMFMNIRVITKEKLIIDYIIASN